MKNARAHRVAEAATNASSPAQAVADDDRAILRRLSAADGYLELQMTDAALRELFAIDDAGHYGAAVDLLTGRVLMARGQYAAAAVPLREAAEALPSPFDRYVWAELETCFRADDEPVLADVAAEFARNSGRPDEDVVDFSDAAEPSHTTAPAGVDQGIADPSGPDYDRDDFADRGGRHRFQAEFPNRRCR